MVRSSSKLTYEEKFSLLNRNMRWEIADLLRKKNLALVNGSHLAIVPRRSLYTRLFKRIIDIAVSGLLLLVTLPFNLIGAVVTFFDVGRPLIFSQRRLGINGELFVLHKFRNMREAFDINGHPLAGKDRVTRLGNFARRTSLDELLNFWSVFRGDMSLIGPRPLVPEYLERYSDRHKMRMALKPGIECPPRTRDVVIRTYDDQFENDVWYAENVSFATDLRLFFRLFSMVFNRKQTKSRANADRGSFMGYNSDGQTIDSNAIPDWALDQVLRNHGLIL